MVSIDIDIDLNSYSDKILYTLQQGEHGGRTIRFNVKNSGYIYSPLPIPELENIYKLQIDKPDGTSIIMSTKDKLIDGRNQLRVENEAPLTLSLNVGKNICAVEGILHCKLSMLQGSTDSNTTTLKSVMFKIRVAAGVKREEDIVSTSEYQRFEDFIDKIDSINEKVTKYENHVSNKLNPHQVTASQVGTYTSQEIDNKIQTAMNSTNFADGRIYSRNSVNMNRKADTTTGSYSFSFGRNNEASGECSHAEGEESVASGDWSHAEGSVSKATAQCSHAEGNVSTANAFASHAEGFRTTANGACSHVEGSSTIASNQDSHAEGQNTKAEGEVSHSEGCNTTASGDYSHSEGYNSSSIGNCAHSEGEHCTASGNHSHSEGFYTTASDQASHSEGYRTKASGLYSHAEGSETESFGSNSHAEGWGSIASGQDSHAEGQNTKAEALYSHAEGKSSTSSKRASHSEGENTIASGDASHAEGYGTNSSAQGSHAEGYNTVASGQTSHAEGSFSTASGLAAHAEGYETVAKGVSSHSEGRETIVGTSCTCQHVQGKYNIEDTENQYADIIGGGTSDSNRKNISALDWEGNLYLSGDIYVNDDKENSLSQLAGPTITYNLSKSGSTIKLTGSDGSESTVIDNNTTYTPATSNTNGLMTPEMVTKLNNISAEANNYTLPASTASTLGGIKTGYTDNGKNYKVQLDGSHNAFVNVPWESGSGSVDTDTYALKSIYGDTTINVGRKPNSTIGEYSSALGYYNTVTGSYCHSEGYDNTSSGNCCHTEGRSNKATYAYGHAEGLSTTASGHASHAEGMETISSGGDAHAEGSKTMANNYAAHAEGYGTTSSAYGSHAEGYCTTATRVGSHASGKFNKKMSNIFFNDYSDETIQTGDCFVIGNGTSETALSNAFRVTYGGEVYGTSAFKSSGADYAEFIKPWHDNNEQNEDRVGYFVTVKNGLLHKASKGDMIAGITSGCPSVVGNADEDYYWRWERDEFNRVIMEDIPETIEKTDENGNVIYDEKTHQPIKIETGNILKNAKMKQSANYDPSKQNTYVERKDRKEWDYVGMIGVLPVRDDGTCTAGHLCKCGTDGTATYASKRDFDTYMVIERINDHVVKVLLK